MAKKYKEQAFFTVNYQKLSGNVKIHIQFLFDFMKPCISKAVSSDIEK